MLPTPEPDRNIEQVNDDEIYAAILYLEADPRGVSKESDDTDKQNDDNGAVICVCLYLAVLGGLAILWLYFR